VTFTPSLGFLFVKILENMNGKENSLVIVNNSSDTMLIDARLLHQQLQISTPFSMWIKRRIEEFGFDENADFYAILSKSNRFTNLLSKKGGQNAVDYHLTMDMAKELAMLERNEVGKRIRQYFIAVEKEARETAGSARLLPKSIHSRQINGRKVYPYRKLAQKLGYTTGGSFYSRRQRYPNHFITFDSIIYVSEEMANLMAMNKSVTRHREAIREMQPLLPLDFGSPIQKLGGGKG
jgi:anti-repressor protein